MDLLLRFILFLAIIPGGFIVGAVSENCVLPNANFVVVPLGPCNITDSEGQTVYSWGTPVTVADQSVCVEVSTATNNFRVISAAVCTSDRGNTTVAQCVSQRGGLFQAAANSTFSDIPVSELVPDSGFDEWNNGEVAVRATLEISDVSLPIDVGVITDGINFTAGYLPLTNESILLQSLVDSGLIAERSFGMQIGTQILNNPQEGTMILGGYNRGSLGGPFMNFSMNYPITPTGGDRECPIQVTVEQLLYKSPTQGDKVLVGNGQQITACIEPYDVKFRFNDPILSLLAYDLGLDPNYTIPNSSFLRPEPGLLVPHNVTFDGSFDFQIANGNESFSVTIPNEALYGPVTGIASDGSITTLSNAIVSEIGVYASPAPRNTAVLGRIFLSQVYLYVNYDQNQFSLAQAGTNMDSVDIPSSNIVQCPTPGLEPSSIVAIVVGVIAFLLILALLLLLWKFYQYWNKQRAATVVRMQESVRKEEPEMEKRDAGRGREEPRDETPRELSPENSRQEAPCNNPSAHLRNGTSFDRLHNSRDRQLSQSSQTTGITSYDPRSERSRNLSLDTTVIGSAANGVRKPSELPDNPMQSPKSPTSPTVVAEVNARDED